RAGCDEDRPAGIRFAQKWIAGADQTPIGVEIDVHDVHPGIRGDVPERGKWSKDAGVADQDVEPAPALVERGAKPVELLAISQVQRQERGRAAFLTDLVV